MNILNNIENKAGLYIHIPFCKSKCSYCAFYSIANQSYEDAYIDSLLSELKTRKALDGWSDKNFSSIYIGGGTPSTLSFKNIEKLFNGIFSELKIEAEAEITFELNPEDREKIATLKSSSPINRLSIGIESFFEKNLSFMRRRHSQKDAIECIEFAKKSFSNLSLDLIYDIPNNSLDDWKQDFETLLSFEPEHFSIYSLTVEENTLLSRMLSEGKISMPSQDFLYELYFLSQEIAEKLGYHCYEVSNFAKKGFESRHNSLYWTCQIPYLGLGCGAHSFWEHKRRANNCNVKHYISNIYNQNSYTQEDLSEIDIFHEYIMNSLRCKKGIEKDVIASFSSHIISDFHKKIEKYLACKLIYETEHSFEPSLQAMYRADGIALDFF